MDCSAREPSNTGVDGILCPKHVDQTLKFATHFLLHGGAVTGGVNVEDAEDRVAVCPSACDVDVGIRDEVLPILAALLEKQRT